VGPSNSGQLRNCPGRVVGLMFSTGAVKLGLCRIAGGGLELAAVAVNYCGGDAAIFVLFRWHN
jgi:hypothetical protein